MGHEVFKPLLKDSVLYCRQCAAMNKNTRQARELDLLLSNELHKN